MFRIGFGNDIHRLEAGRPLIIGGVSIDSDLGAVGHSDADVLLHAVTDAVLGALAQGDIGSHFPNTDPKWANANSSTFLVEAVRLMKAHGYKLANLDSTIEIEQPKLRPYVDKMRENLAQAMGVTTAQISIKAKTGEGLDAVGTRAAVKATVVVLLETEN